MKKEEYKERFIKQLAKNHKNFFEIIAQASWEVYNDDSEGLKYETPENMADEEMDSWE